MGPPRPGGAPLAPLLPALVPVRSAGADRAQDLSGSDPSSLEWGRWRSLTPVGQPIPGTRFIAFKVPLKGAINQRLTPTQKFTPKDLIAAMKALNVELGLIIDLTYTTRYYEVKDLPKSVQYKKLYTVGLEVPDNATILQFKKWVRKFLWENAGNGKLIGVHCTNGINRTGYLICRYLIDVEGWDPEAAIQAFGDARGHRMDGLVYLTDLRTQPMRRSGKRLRIYDDHPHSDLQGQLQLRDFDFINKGPGQRRRPFHDHQTQDDLRAPMQMRNWDYNRGPGQRQRPFPDHQFYDDYQEDVQLKDLDFSNKGPGQRLRPFHGHQFHDDLQAERQSRDIEFNRGRGQRQRSFPDCPSHSDLQEDRQSKDYDFGSRGRGQRRRPFHDHQSHDEFQTQMQLKELECVNKGPGQRHRSFHDYQSHDDLQPQMQLGDFEFVNRGRGQRSRPFNDHQPRNDLQTEVQLKDYDNKGPGQRRRPFHDHQPYDDLQEQTQLKDFDYVNKGHGQRPRPFRDHPGHDDLPREWCSDRSQSFSSHENVPEPHFSSSPSLHGDYGSDSDDFNRSYSNRPNCPEDNRRMHPSDEFNRGKNRFAPYSSRTMHPSSSVHQEDSSIDYERKPFQGETTREVEQSKRLPVVTVDYNYGLPLDYGPEKEERTHYDLPPRDRYNWN
ncbi:PREDICTED: RNA/RNP complex-1-interacting phosphatase [Nipponia nippon]|nr:PREDICTED: RNA/RNP complex-1-interacting phosphatase [Nipponia nippon]